MKLWNHAFRKRKLKKLFSISSMTKNNLGLSALWSILLVCISSSVQFSHSVMSDSVRPHRWRPTRVPHPWDSPGKNTGVGCHFLLQCMKVKSESEVAQSCPTLSNPMHINCCLNKKVQFPFFAKY